MIEGVHYKRINGRYKYELLQDVKVQTSIYFNNVSHAFFALTDAGALTARKGYQWDGATSCPDFAFGFKGFLFHDVGYQMLREGRLSEYPAERELMRMKFDKLLRDLCLAGANIFQKPLAWTIYAAVRVFGSKYAEGPKNA